MKITVAHFSPTGNSKTYGLEVAKRLGEEVQELDLTNREVRKITYNFEEKDLVIFCAPVYAGRIPTINGGIFDRIHGNRTPAVFLVNYGNRAYEDALLELKNICEANGFHGIGAGAFVGPHSFSERIGAGRPDEHDLAAVSQLVEGIQAAFADATAMQKELIVKGNMPYRDGMNLPFGPVADEKCIRCGLCARKCPVGAIPEDAPWKTDFEVCIACMRCVRKCPRNSRQMMAPPFAGMVKKLEAGILERYAEPEIFLI